MPPHVRWIEVDADADVHMYRRFHTCDHRLGVCCGEFVDKVVDTPEGTKKARLLSHRPICFRHSGKAIRVSTPEGPKEWKLNLEKRHKEVFATADDPSDPEALWLRFTTPVTPHDIAKALPTVELCGPMQYIVLDGYRGYSLDDNETILRGQCQLSLNA